MRSGLRIGMVGERRFVVEPAHTIDSGGVDPWSLIQDNWDNCHFRCHGPLVEGSWQSPGAVANWGPGREEVVFELAWAGSQLDQGAGDGNLP